MCIFDVYCFDVVINVLIITFAEGGHVFAFVCFCVSVLIHSESYRLMTKLLDGWYVRPATNHSISVVIRIP